MDLSPLMLSLKTATLSVLITFFLGVFAARWVGRLRREWLKTTLDGILTLPMVLPPTVAGFFLLYLFGVNRPLGQLFFSVFGVRIAFSWGATVLAAVVISFPLMYRAARGAFEQVDASFIHAACTLGMPEGKIFWRIVLPLAMPGVASGGVLAFARALGEFGATAMIAGNIPGRTRTLPMAIYSAAASGDMDTAGDYVLVIVLVSFAVIVVMNYFASKQRHFSGGKGAAE